MKIHNPILSTVEKAAQDGLRAAGRAILKRSNELAPKDTEETIKTGRVNIDDLTVQVSYASFIARIQHENLDYQHDDGEAKFLEQATMQVDLEQIMADVMRRRLGG